MSYTPFDRVESYLRRFVIYPSEHALTAHVLWIAHTHLMDCWESTPRLAFMSPEPESGKTRALEVTSLFVPNARLSFSMSAAALVRIIAKGHETGAIPTILYDEIDNLFSKSEEGISDLRGALNSGYRRNAVSTRCVNKGEGIADFACFAPLALAGLKMLPDALATRAIFIHMRPRAADEHKESFRLKHHPAQAKPIMDHLAEWCAKINGDLIVHEPKMPASITDRSADIWEPLIAIADVAGDDWPKSDFVDVWKRYLGTSPLSATSATSATNLVNKDNLVAEVAEVAFGRAEEFDDLEVAFEERAAICSMRAGFLAKMPRVQVPEFLRTRRMAS
jgi:hypothetical protein